MSDGQEGKKSPKRSRRNLLILLVILLLVGIGVKWFFFSQPFLYAGTLEVTKVDLSSRLASVIDQVRVQEGDRVKTGEVLVTLLCDDVKVADDLATINYQRTLKLKKAGTVSQETMDQARNRKEDADVRLGWCTIRSPIDGTVLSRYHEPGEWVTPGTKLLALANIKDIWAYIYVPQPKVGSLRVGETLEGILPELHGRAFTGRIIKINEEAEFTPKNVQTEAERTRLVYGVKVSFLGSNQEEVLKPGMTIEISLPRQ